MKMAYQSQKAKNSSSMSTIILLGEIVLPDGEDIAAELFYKAAPWLRAEWAWQKQRVWKVYC